LFLFLPTAHHTARCRMPECSRPDGNVASLHERREPDLLRSPLFKISLGRRVIQALSAMPNWRGDLREVGRGTSPTGHDA
jgi:hypothetical protein